jgi:hypothetical protein
MFALAEAFARRQDAEDTFGVRVFRKVEPARDSEHERGRSEARPVRSVHREHVLVGHVDTGNQVCEEVAAEVSGQFAAEADLEGGACRRGDVLERD